MGANVDAPNNIMALYYWGQGTYQGQALGWHAVSYALAVIWSVKLEDWDIELQRGRVLNEDEMESRPEVPKSL